MVTSHYDALLQRGFRSIHPLLAALSYYVRICSICIFKYTMCRRCGSFCYKPTMHETCCPAYTMRLPVPQFNLSRSQRKYVRKVNKVLASLAGESVQSECSEGEKVHGADSGFGLALHLVTVETVPPACTEERFALYKRYQV